MGAIPARAHVGTRTRDLFLTKEVLYRLSYVSVPTHVRQDSNLQPPVLETGALPIELRTYTPQPSGQGQN